MAVNLEAEAFTATTTEATSVVRGPGGLRVTHHFRNSTNDHLLAVDVHVENTRSVPSGPLRYRRAIYFDIDMPGCHTGFTTIAKTSPSVKVPYLTFASSQPTLGLIYEDSTPWGRDADPLNAYRGEVTGFFTDFHHPESSTCRAGWLSSAFFELNLGEIGPGKSAQFTLYFGAAPNESTAIQAIQSVPSQMYVLGQPWAGAETGEPITGIVAVDGSNIPSVYIPGVE
jgi:hypothetical protein